MSVSIENLKQRSALLQTVRCFFLERGFTEVETPIRSDEVIPELHIEPVRSGKAFLQASPELHMKLLVVAGMEAIFQITRSFRDDERGPLHNPEFTIVEWYRTGDDMQASMQLLDELCQATLGTDTAVRTSYAEAFHAHVGICPHTATVDQLAERATQMKLPVANSFPGDDRDEWLNMMLSLVVEKQLGRHGPEILYDYPASQAALAKTTLREHGAEVAERFELYWRGVELANGYHELTNAMELRRRLTDVNQNREREGRQALPMPVKLLDAMERGLPSCAGCALGFDRLVMLVLGKNTFTEASALRD